MPHRAARSKLQEVQNRFASWDHRVGWDRWLCRKFCESTSPSWRVRRTDWDVHSRVPGRLGERSEPELAVLDNNGILVSAPRWVRVHTWYPAVANSGRLMTFADYLDSEKPKSVPAVVADLVHRNDLGTPTYSLRGIYRNDAAAFARTLSSEVAGHLLAHPATGRFPVIVYSVGQNDFTQDSVSMAEYLASNGFIVTTVPDLGTSQVRPILFSYEPSSYEVQLRDLELALTHTLELPIADSSRIAAVGHSYGGTYALLLAMRGSMVKGIVTLDPAYIAEQLPYAYDIRKFPFFNLNVRFPIVTLRRGSMDLDRAVVDSFLRADRLEIVYPNMTHFDFTTRAFLRRDLPPALQPEDDLNVRSPGLGAQAASQVLRQVLRSLQCIFAKGDLSASVTVDDQVPQEVHYAAAIGAPTEEEIFLKYEAKGLEAAERSVQDAETRDKNLAVFNEKAFLTIARELGYAEKNAESLDMFRLVAMAFPRSVSAQLAAAQAVFDNGLNSEAGSIFQRVLQLDPSNQTAIQGLTKIHK